MSAPECAGLCGVSRILRAKGAEGCDCHHFGGNWERLGGGWEGLSKLSLGLWKKPTVADGQHDFVVHRVRCSLEVDIKTASTHWPSKWNP